MHNMEKHIMRFLILIISIVALTSCNWNIISANPEDLNPGSDNPASVIVFTGEAPKNVYASQAVYADSVIVSFDGVAGADTYILERIIVEKASPEYEETDWRILSIIPADSSSNRYSYTDTDITTADYVYLYRVKASSLYSEFKGDVTAKYSSIARGWPLSPPTSLTASQGEYNNKIVLEWSQVDLVAGYDIYAYIPDDNAPETWTKINNKIIPASYGAGMISYGYDSIPENAAGIDISFKVKSISRGNAESDFSGARIGYTYMPGAPNTPEDLEATDAYSSEYIQVSWKMPDVQGVSEEQSYFRWEIYRSTPTTDQELICSFNYNSYNPPATLTENVSISEDGEYFVFKDFRDNRTVSAGVEYTYTVRAVKIEPTSSEGNTVQLIGKSDSDTGMLIEPSVTITDTNTTYPDASGAGGSFEFTINPPKVLPTCDSWAYSIWGRHNYIDQEVGDWVFLQEIDGNGGANPVSVKIPYNPGTEINEFDVRIKDSEGAVSLGYASFYNEPIVTKRQVAPSASILTVSQNKFDSRLEDLANASGVYPVIAKIGTDPNYKVFQIGAYSLNISGDSAEQGVVTLNSEDEIVLTNLSPTSVGEKWYYKVRGADVYGRWSEWSTANSSTSDKYAEGYGAITGEAFIKFFEAYAMKPWEFINHSDFPANLKTKWSTNEITRRIVNAVAEECNIPQASEYHNGTMTYNVKVVIPNGVITFTYSNFGEIEEIWTESGSYSMSVGLSGNGSISANKPFIIKGMYPATIRIDPAYMTVKSKAFEGDYVVIQENGKGQELVKATRN